MRIYAVADIHGRPERLELVRSFTERLKPDRVVAAGDLAHYRRPRPVLAALARLPVPVLAVRGNTDPRRMEAMLAATGNLTALHLRRQDVDPWAFVGLSGTLPLPFRSLVGWSENTLLAQAAGLVNRATIIVAHPPPYGVCDRVLGKLHAGSRGLRRLVLRHRPAVLICGHIHEAAGTGRLGDTLVVNCSLGGGGAGASIDCRPGRPPQVQQLR